MITTVKKKRGVREFWRLGLPEYATGHFDVNKSGELIVREGNYQYNVHDLCERFGTSLELVFPHILEERLTAALDVFRSSMRQTKYRGKFYFHYPMKVNQSKEFVLPLVSEGAHLETSSVNELWIVKRMWEQEQFSTKIRVLCNGPKTNRYLSLIEELKNKNLDIVPIIENHWELEYLNGYRGEVGIRLDPDMKVHSHWDKQTDQFGFSMQALAALGKIRNLKLLSYHIGSQAMRVEDLVLPIRRAMELFARMKRVNHQLDALNIGGGFAVPYEKKRPLYSVEIAAKKIVKALKTSAERHGIAHPDLIVEWGRHVAAPAQLTLYKIIAAKPITRNGGSERPVKHWYFIDGSFMNDLPDTWAIRQRWHVIPINRMDAPKLARVWLSGSSCDSDDKYTNGGSYLSLPPVADLKEAEAQYVAVLDTGAYQDALASHHCLLSAPARLVIQNGVVTVARKRESPEDVGKQFGW